MTYDYTNRNEPPGSIAPTEWTMDVLAYAETVMDLSKVRLGLPFYGYTWMRGNPPATTVTWESVSRWVKGFALEVQRTDDMQAFAEVKARGLPSQTVYFSDAVGLRFKLEQIITAYPTLGGVAIWGLGGEDPENWGVLRDLRPASCSQS
jgi:spore germination protein